MKISQEDVILIKNLYMSKHYGARRLLNELSDKGWKLGSIDSLLNRSLLSETGDTIGFRQQLNMTSFEACELEITVNYFSVYT